MAIYYPSVAANMTIRFDEALLDGTTPDPKTPTDGANSQLGGPGLPVSKAGLLSGASSRLTHVMALVPRAASIELPTFRQTPKFSLTFAFQDFPIDPRAIRALGVEIYIGVVTGDQWSRGMRGQIDGDRLASQIDLVPANLMLAGIVDSLTTTHGDHGSEVKVDGKGFSGMMLSAKVNSAQLAKLDQNQRLDQVIAQLLGMDAQSAQIPIRTSAADWPLGIPKPGPLEILSRSNKGASGKKANRAIKGDPNSTGVWDVITNLCNPVGAVPYFIGHELWIRPARSIYDQKNAGLTGTTPFKDGNDRLIQTTKEVQPISFRKMVYGRNLSSLSFERKFGSTTVPTVNCVSVATDSTEKGIKRLLNGTWPPPGNPKASTTAVDPSGNASRSEILNIPVPGITDETRLQFIAEQIYNEIGRGEMGGSASSKDLASLGGDNDDVDLIRLRPGDAVEFLVDAAGLQSVPPVVSELNSKAAMSPDEAIKSISDKLGGRKDLAAVLVGTARGSFNALQSVFRVNNVKYTWDVKAGIGVDFDFHNFMEVRYAREGTSTEGEIGDFSSKPVTGSGFSSSSGRGAA